MSGINEPQADDAEAWVLGTVLGEPKSAEEFTRILRPEDFRIEMHRKVAAAIIQLRRGEVEPTAIAVSHLLGAEISPAEISNLAAIGGSSEHLRQHCAIVGIAAKKRRLLDILLRGAKIVGNGSDPDQIDRLQTELIEVASHSLRFEAERCIEFMDLTSLLNEEIGVPWFVKQWCAKGDLVIIGAEYGTGKTWLAMAMALATCGDQSFLEETIDCKGPVLYVDGENPVHLIRKRLRKLGGAEPPRGLHVLHLPPMQIEKPQGIALLEQAVTQTAPALVILDTLSKFHSLNENKADEMSRVILPLLRLARTHGCVVLVLHHYGKDPEGIRSARSRLRGSSAIGDHADQVWALERGPSKLRLVHVKSRHDAPAETLDLRINDDEYGKRTEIVVTGRGNETAVNDYADVLLAYLQEKATSGATLFPRKDLVSQFSAKRGWHDKTLARALSELFTRRLIGKTPQSKDGVSYFLK